jgi:glutathione peroxidase
MSIYDFSVNNSKGESQSLEQHKGKVLLIVNTASKCGFTPQYAELQTLHEQFHNQGLEILAFPCDQFAHQEPGSDSEIQQFCLINYGLTFPVLAKIEVNGKNAHPLFQYLRSQKKSLLGDSIKWNFTKFLVSRDGDTIERFEPNVKPLEMAPKIEAFLAEEIHA